MNQPENHRFEAAEKAAPNYDKTLIMIKSAVLALGIVFLVLVAILLVFVNKKSGHNKPDINKYRQAR